MTKIAFIGGGSVQWTPKLVTDMASTDPLEGSQLVLHDVDEEALDLLTSASRLVSAQAGDTLEIAATLDREEALEDADFVILCVAIGGLPAMRNDLEIPEKYGICQPVGDTVGPGGIARALRHVPFAVQIAHEMERLCPHAWLINVTNPMTTICRGVTRVTEIRTIGLCHEVTGVTQRLAEIFEVPVESISVSVAGLNHLPVVLDLEIDGEDGIALLRRWMEENGALDLVGDMQMESVFDVFEDRFGVKLTLLEKLGVLFGAGDRHVAEFFPHFLREETDWGARYGVALTTVDQRERIMAIRRARINRFVEEEEVWNLEHSDEQLAPVMGALVGGEPGRFIVNVPNRGQVSNLPRGTVVECIAEIDILGVRPLVVGALPCPAYATIASHVAEQELIVEAALTGKRAPALAALAVDPLVRDLEVVAPMLEELLEANARAV
jgi:alpha-galactosidase